MVHLGHLSPHHPILRAARGVRYLAYLARISPRAARASGSSAVTTFLRGLRLRRKFGFLPDTSYHVGLLDPGISDAEIARFSSQRATLKAQRIINPQEFEALTEDKVVFDRVARAGGIPVPEILAVVRRTGAGWSTQGPRESEEEWCRFLAELAQDEFVIKPVDGVYARGFRVFRKQGERFLDLATGVTVGAKDIIEGIRKDRRFAGHLIQERLVNHPAIRELNGTDFPARFRMTTLVDDRGTPHLISTSLIHVVGKNVTSTFDNGRTGNLISWVDLDTGVTESGYIYRSDGPGIEERTHHPDTGRSLGGFRVPLWPEIRDVVVRAARCFLPIRTIGWDVALTPRGPVILEGNMWWDPCPWRDTQARLEQGIAGRFDAAWVPDSPSRSPQ